MLASQGPTRIQDAFFGALGASPWFGVTSAAGTAALLLAGGIHRKRRPLFIAIWLGFVVLLLTLDKENAVLWRLAVAGGCTALTVFILDGVTRSPHRFRREIARASLVPIISCLPGSYVLFRAVTLLPQTHDLKMLLTDLALGAPSIRMCKLVLSSFAFSYVLLVVYYLVPVCLYGLFLLGYHKRREGSELIFQATLAGLVAAAVYMMVPVVGPRYTFYEYPFGALQVEVLLRQVNRVLVMPPILPRNCMPSMHMTWALIFWQHSRRYGRLVECLGWFFMVGTAMATLGLGFHYAIDLLPSFPFALMVVEWKPVRGWRPDSRFLLQGALFLFWVFAPLSLATNMYHHPWLVRTLATVTVGQFLATRWNWGRLRECLGRLKHADNLSPVQ